MLPSGREVALGFPSMALTPDQAFTISRIAAILSVHVTTAQIEEIAYALDLHRDIEGSNKGAKLAWLLRELVRTRKLSQAESAILTLVVHAHERTVRRATSLTSAEVDKVVEGMRGLGLRPGDLARAKWRKDLPGGTKTAASAAPPSSDTSRAPTPTSSGLKPVRYDEACLLVRQMTAQGYDPHLRGKQLEKLVHGLLLVEKLDPEANLTSPGEEIDLAFTLDGQHYLVECKWENSRVGLPHVRQFSDKVGTKAVGTFGVFVSMSGFVEDIDLKYAAGRQPNCVGLTHKHLIDIIEGRSTWSAEVRRARRAASGKSFQFTS